MSDSYYLINDQIKFYFDIENLHIEFNGQQQALEPKEAQILKYILENQVDGLINSEVILDANWDYWNDKKVLQKVLSTLRKKFKSIDVTENGFIAADANYKINYHAVLINEKVQAKEKQKQIRDKYLGYAKTAIPAILVVVAIFVAISTFDQGPKFSVGDIIQSTAISGASVEPDLSPDGTALAFSHKKEGSSQIYLKLDASPGFAVLTEGHYDQAPSWSPSGRQLAFQRYEPGICEIRLIKLDEELQKIGNDQRIAQCNKYTNLMSITWKDEDTLYFTESKSTIGPSEIKQLDLKTAQVTTYFGYDKMAPGTASNGSGHYYIVYNADQNSLFSLQSPDWKITHITKVHDDNSITFLHKVGLKLFSFDIFDSQVIFKDIDNQLKSFDLDEPGKLTTIYKNPLKTISYPAVSDNSNKIALVSGSVFKNSLHSLDINTGIIDEIMDSDNLVEHPKHIGDETWYMSSQSGIYQVYRYQNKVKTQITNFNKNQQILYFNLSNDKQWLAISFADSTIIYQRSETGLTAVKTFEGTAYPDFSKNSDRILLSKRVSSDKDPAAATEKVLTEFFLKDFKETGITIRDASYGIYHDNGIIFPGNDNSLKLFKLDGIETLIESIRVSNRCFIAVNDNNLFVSNSVSKVIKVDLNTLQRSEIKASITGEISVDDSHLFFKKRDQASMMIFKGELTAM